MSKTIPFEELDDNRFPYCPKCGHKMIWQNDYDSEDLGYEGEPFVVNQMYCPNCESVVDCRSSSEGCEIL